MPSQSCKWDSLVLWHSHYCISSQMASLYRHSGITMSPHRHHYIVPQTWQCMSSHRHYYIVTQTLLYRHTDINISSHITSLYRHTDITISSHRHHCRHRHHYIVPQTWQCISSHWHYYIVTQTPLYRHRTSLYRHTCITISSHKHHYIVTHTLYLVPQTLLVVTQTWL